MTEGFSKSNNKYYLYYRCTKERRRNYRGELLYEKVEEVLHCLSFSDGQITKISTYGKAELSKATNYRTQLLESKYREFNSVSAKIEGLEEKMVNDQIEASTYKTWFARLNAERDALENDIIRLKKDKQTMFDRLDEAISMFCDLRNLYISTTLEGQQMFLKEVFEVGLMYDGHILRTPMINPALVDN